VLDTPEARAMAAMFGVNITAVVDALSGDLAGALLKSAAPLCCVSMVFQCRLQTKRCLLDCR
jgi:hypothetical protein